MQVQWKSALILYLLQSFIVVIDILSFHWTSDSAFCVIQAWLLHVCQMYQNDNLMN